MTKHYLYLYEIILTYKRISDATFVSSITYQHAMISIRFMMILSHSSTICLIWQPRFDLCSGMVPVFDIFPTQKNVRMSIHVLTMFIDFHSLFIVMLFL